MKRILYIIIFCFISNGLLHAQDKSNKGKEFWLGYGFNVLFDVADQGLPPNNQQLVLYISADVATDVTVSINGTAWDTTVHVAANSVNVGINIPKEGINDCRITQEGVYDRGIHIVSTEPVVIYAHQFNSQLSGATMLLPVDTYGYTYYAINYKQPNVGGTPAKNWFFVVASEDNTKLEITPTDTTDGGWLPGNTYTVTLNKGQLYNVFGKIGDDGITKDLTGSKVVSVQGSDGNCHPVALFSGCSRFILCATDGGEVAQQQIFPASAWGTRYLTFHSLNVVSNPLTTPFLNFYRVLVNDPSTIVMKNGVALTGLVNNRYYEYQSTSGDYIEADKPVMVCQYTPNSNQCTGNSLSPQGDPELIFLSPIEQNIKQARVYNTKNSNINIAYLTVIIPNNGITSLLIDGAAVPASQRMVHPNNPAYTVVAKRLLGPGAQHIITSDSAFSAIIYGTGTFESYGYIAGTLINNLNCIGSIENVYNKTNTPTVFTCPASPFQSTIKTAYKASSFKWLFSQVNGLTPSADTFVNNPVIIDSQLLHGRKYYTYHLDTHLSFSDTGTFTIPVEYSSPEIDHCSHMDKGFVTVVVKPSPVADLSYTYKGCTTDTARFTGLPASNNFIIDTYIWTNGNINDTAATFATVFTTEGDHNIKLQVISKDGCFGDTTKIISTYPKPFAKFGFEKTICVADSVLLNDSSSITSGSITNWQWNFGDGTSANINNGNSFHHTYNTVDSFTVSLQVMSDKGCLSDTATKLVPVNARPVAGFGIEGKQCLDSTIRFITIYTENGNTIQSAWWSYGDGQTEVVPNAAPVTHSYSFAGTNIPVRFMISGGSGCESDTVLRYVPVIFPNPVADFSVATHSFCRDEEVTFTYNSSDIVNQWQWTVDGVTSNAASSIKQSFIEGDHNITLTVTTGEGCGSKPLSKTITIYKLPSIDAGPTIYKTGSQPVELEASLADSGSYQFVWTPATSLSAGNVLRPTTTTNTDIIYKITATGGPAGCSASDTVSVKVLLDLFIPSAFTPNNDGLNDVWNIPSINGNNNAMVTIYNRYGQIIYQSKGYSKPWDGTYQGVAQPHGSYVYMIQPDVRKEKKITGFVSIIR